MIIAFMAFILSSTLLITSPTRNCNYSHSEIAKIGVCDHYGKCAVILKNKRKEIIKSPFIGETVYYQVCD